MSMRERSARKAKSAELCSCFEIVTLRHEVPGFAALERCDWAAIMRLGAGPAFIPQPIARPVREAAGRPPAKPSIIEACGDGIARVHLVNSEHVAVIDVADIQVVSGCAWYLRKSKGRQYATLSATHGHRMIHQLIQPGSPIIDHRDGDGLNNRRANLRPCAQMQNTWNRRKSLKPCSSRYKGVRLNGRAWESSIMANSRRHHLGSFRLEEDAARAYDAAAIQLHGDFACLNFPKEAA